MQDILTMDSLQNDRYKIIFPSTSWHMASFTSLPQLPFTCGDQIVLFQFPPVWMWLDCPWWVFSCENDTAKVVCLAVYAQTQIRSTRQDERTAKAVLMVGESSCCLSDLVCFFQNEHHFPSAVISSYQWLCVTFLDIHQFRYCSLVMLARESTETPMEISSDNMHGIHFAKRSVQTDLCARMKFLQPVEIACIYFRISLSYNQWIPKEQLDFTSFSPLLFSCHTAVNLHS